MNSNSPIFEEISLIKERHNGILSDLEKSSEVLKVQCNEIDEELNLHNDYLDEIKQTTETNQRMMERVTEKLEGMLEKYSNNSLLCTIFLLILVLMIVIAL
jgi:phosphomevalonate kinase